MSQPLPDEPSAQAARPARSTQSESDLFAHVYMDLVDVARGFLGRERRGRFHTLEPAALVHEAWLRLAGHDQGQTELDLKRLAAKRMREVLVDHARRIRARKRMPADKRVSITVVGDLIGSTPVSLDSLLVDDALSRLAKLDKTRAEVVELRFFGGMTHEEIAVVLEVSLSTVEKLSRGARAWLKVELADAAPGSGT